MKRIFAFAVLVAILVATAVHAQHPNVERGFKPDKIYEFDEQGLGAVNLLNGGLTIGLDLGITYPVGGSFS